MTRKLVFCSRDVRSQGENPDNTISSLRLTIVWKITNIKIECGACQMHLECIFTIATMVEHFVFLNEKTGEKCLGFYKVFH